MTGILEKQHGKESLEPCEGLTLDGYLRKMKDEYGIEPEMVENVDRSLKASSKYTIPEEILRVVEACYQLRMKQIESNNRSVGE